MTADLPPWTGIDITSGEKMKENQLEPENQEQHIRNEEQPGPVSENTAKEIKQEDISAEDLSYSNIEDTHDPSTTQRNPQTQDHIVLPGGDKSLTEEIHDDKESVYESISPVAGPSLSAPPPKPLPYSLSKKKKSSASDDGDKLAEKVPSECFTSKVNFNFVIRKPTFILNFSNLIT